MTISRKDTEDHYDLRKDAEVQDNISKGYFAAMNIVHCDINGATTAPLSKRHCSYCDTAAGCDMLRQLVRRQGLSLSLSLAMKVTQSAWPWKLGHGLTRSQMYLFIRWPSEDSAFWLQFRIVTSLCKWRRR
jgi:hypothetical protein